MTALRQLASTAITKFGLRDVFLRLLDEPERYVRSDKVSGQLQFELIKREGCRPYSKVLEIGCGCLHVAIPLLQYLERGNYVGIDPNEWLRNSAMKDEEVARLVAGKEARFLSVDDFDASSFGVAFDLVFSHSVLSHFAHWQLDVFLRNTTKVLAPRGRILASIALAEGNAYGNPGSPNKRDSGCAEWVYPASSFFTMATVEEAAAKQGLSVTNVAEYTAFVTETRDRETAVKECHDWLVFRRVGDV